MADTGVEAQLTRIADALERIVASLDHRAATEADRGVARATPHPYVHLEGVSRCAACHLEAANPVHQAA